MHIYSFAHLQLDILRFPVQFEAGFELAAVDAALHAEQEGGEEGEVTYHGHQQGYR